MGGRHDSFFPRRDRSGVLPVAPAAGDVADTTMVGDAILDNT
jgi:hypothetical protein